MAGTPVPGRRERKRARQDDTHAALILLIGCVPYWGPDVLVAVGLEVVGGSATGAGLLDVGGNDSDFGASGTVVIALSGLSR
jgi:hypothetical protein